MNDIYKMNRTFWTLRKANYVEKRADSSHTAVVVDATHERPFMRAVWQGDETVVPKRA